MDEYYKILQEQFEQTRHDLLKADIKSDQAYTIKIASVALKTNEEKQNQNIYYEQKPETPKKTKKKHKKILLDQNIFKLAQKKQKSPPNKEKEINSLKQILQPTTPQITKFNPFSEESNKNKLNGKIKGDHNIFKKKLMDLMYSVPSIKTPKKDLIKSYLIGSSKIWEKTSEKQSIIQGAFQQTDRYVIRLKSPFLPARKDVNNAYSFTPKQELQRKVDILSEIELESAKSNRRYNKNNQNVKTECSETGITSYRPLQIQIDTQISVGNDTFLQQQQYQKPNSGSNRQVLKIKQMKLSQVVTPNSDFFENETSKYFQKYPIKSLITNVAKIYQPYSQKQTLSLSSNQMTSVQKKGKQNQVQSSTVIFYNNPNLKQMDRKDDNPMILNKSQDQFKSDYFLINFKNQFSEPQTTKTFVNNFNYQQNTNKVIHRPCSAFRLKQPVKYF